MVSAMSAKSNRRVNPTRVRTPDAPGTDAELERFVADHHEEIEAKLRKARASIARGKAKPLEALETLMRAARRRAKTAG